LTTGSARALCRRAAAVDRSYETNGAKSRVATICRVAKRMLEGLEC
jgi:hypothetical protein